MQITLEQGPPYVALPFALAHLVEGESPPSRSVSGSLAAKVVGWRSAF